MRRMLRSAFFAAYSLSLASEPFALAQLVLWLNYELLTSLRNKIVYFLVSYLAVSLIPSLPLNPEGGIVPILLPPSGA